MRIFAKLKKINIFLIILGKNMNFPENLKYSADHEWIKVEGNIGTIGISYHAQSELGDVVYVDIAEDLVEIVKDESFGTIEAVKTVTDVNAPCSGKVIQVNREINSNPEIVNQDPYGEGWMIKIEIENPAELDSLMTATKYKEFIGS